MALRIKRMSTGAIAAAGFDTRANQAMLFIDAGDIRAVNLDLSDYLATGQSISSVATSGSNLTISTPSSASGVISFNLTGPSGSGYADITATLSTGEKVTQRIHARETQPSMTLRDYVS